MSQIKLIATDLDGTLLQNYVPNCSQEAIELITALVKKGIYVMPASGRQLPNLQRMFEKVDGKLMYLCENGAVVTYGDEVILKHSFEKDFAMELSHMVMETEDCEVLISGERTSYIIPKNPEYEDYLRNHIKNNVTVVSTPEEIKEPIVKISAFVEKEKQEKKTAYFEKQIDNRCQILIAGHEWIDFAPFGTSKGDALREIGEKLGITAEEMVAFGDNENDRSMLEYVGQPYLMKVCNPTMEDVSATRIDNVEEELHKILERL